MTQRHESSIEQNEHAWRWRHPERVESVAVYNGVGIRIEVMKQNETRSVELPQDAADSVLRWIFERQR